MTISALTSATASTATTATNQLKGTKDEFLKMFMAQLQNQDPLDPQKGADMVAQLAQFSSVEQAEQTNTQLAALTAQTTSTASASMSSLVGRDCSATAGDFQLDGTGGAPPPLQLTSTGQLHGASVVITNADGKEIRRIQIPDGAAGSVQWDGKDASGNPVAPGSYHVAVDGGASTAAVTAQWHGPIGSVELTDSGPRLRMGDLLVAPGDIRSIGNQTTSIPATAALTAISATTAQGTH